MSAQVPGQCYAVYKESYWFIQPVTSNEQCEKCTHAIQIARKFWIPAAQTSTLERLPSKILWVWMELASWGSNFSWGIYRRILLRTATVAVFTEFLQRCPRTASDQVTTDSQGGFKYGRHIIKVVIAMSVPLGWMGLFLIWSISGPTAFIMRNSLTIMRCHWQHSLPSMPVMCCDSSLA